MNVLCESLMCFVFHAKCCTVIIYIHGAHLSNLVNKLHLHIFPRVWFAFIWQYIVHHFLPDLYCKSLKNLCQHTRIHQYLSKYANCC